MVARQRAVAKSATPTPDIAKAWADAVEQVRAETTAGVEAAYLGALNVDGLDPSQFHKDALAALHRQIARVRHTIADPALNAGRLVAHLECAARQTFAHRMHDLKVMVPAGLLTLTLAPCPEDHRHDRS